jgi:AAA+ ATPase superfamily predicted ATPase
MRTAKTLRKPREVFDRAREWESLVRFVADPSARARLGIVYGRRRQGKSWLLERISNRVGGWYWEAIEGTARQQLDAFASAFSDWTKLPARPHFEGWSEALQAVWQAGPPVMVLDELQHLVASAPELPSVLQTRVSREGGPRLIVCGSALGPMRGLLRSDAPLRGRASLELIVGPFDYRIAARFWRAKDKIAAVQLHSLVGGTPAYLDFAAGRTPTSVAAFDDWVCDVLLNPAGALFREGRLLTDEPTLQDRSLYHGILAAVAGGRTRRGQIAAALGRPENTLAHPLNALVELALLERIDDPLHARRSTFRLAEPMLRTYETLIAPHEGMIERRGARKVWNALRTTVSGQIYGPHFEHLAREWVATHASEQTLGGVPNAVGPSVVPDTAARKELEIDVVACSGNRVIALGEAKWTGRPIGLGVLATLERKKTLLGSRAEAAKLLLFGSGGFDRDLRARARLADLELVDLQRLYHGD